ncbi:hypothetical protein ABZU45_42415, partial [Streptomyces avermitilis]|uniref:hypothetical protein n=1 Tax=Streptomyces avermitilis TaxID=33903 RepID=UPI0033B1E75E
MTDAAGTDRDQGLAQPDGRLDAGARPRSSERDELFLGVPVALLSAADLLCRPIGSARIPGILNVGKPEPACQLMAAAVPRAGSGLDAISFGVILRQSGAVTASLVERMVPDGLW